MLQRTDEESAGGFQISLLGDQDVDDLAELTDCSVKVDPSPRGCDVCFVDEPLITTGVPAGSCRVDQQRREPLHPPVHADVVDGDPTLNQQFFHVSIGEPIAQVPANRERDHIRREAEPAKLDLDADTPRQRRRIDQACLILLSTDATDPFGQQEPTAWRSIPG